MINYVDRLSVSITRASKLPVRLSISVLLHQTYRECDR